MFALTFLSLEKVEFLLKEMFLADKTFYSLSLLLSFLLLLSLLVSVLLLLLPLVSFCAPFSSNFIWKSDPRRARKAFSECLSYLTHVAACLLPLECCHWLLNRLKSRKISSERYNHVNIKPS